MQMKPRQERGFQQKKKHGPRNRFIQEGIGDGVTYKHFAINLH